VSRKRTGLRNRFRNGRGPYSINRKARTADMYGEYQNGKQVKQDVIAGHVLVTHDRIDRRIVNMVGLPKAID
jgi:hypothetical protein